MKIIYVGSRFLNRAHYNEFGKEMGPKVELWWGDDLFWGWKIHRTGRPNVPRRKGASPEDGNSQLLSHPRSLSPFYVPSRLLLLWVISVVIYPSLPFILLLICQSSMPILECTFHRPLFLALCELLWPPPHCPGVTSISMGSGCWLWVFNTEVTASLGVAFLPCSYG